MNIFISYASEQSERAQEIALALREEGHEVFLDRSALGEGDAYNARIRDAIRDCDLLVFLVSPEAVSAGRYTLTEIKFAEERWPSPAGHVLPVMVRPTKSETIPAYLRAVVMLRPGGSTAAEVVAAVARLSRPRWVHLVRRYAAVFLLLAALVVSGACFAVSRGWQRWRACGEAAQLAQAGSLQQDAGDYAAAWDRYADALALCPGSSPAAEGQARLAMDWLDNIRVTRGKETFTDIVNKLLPVLSKRTVCVDGRRAADALAHLGWADFLRSREGTGGLDPVHYYRQALERDPGNPYAHAMWGHYIVQRSGAIEEAKAHFVRALDSAEQRHYIRGMQIAAYLWSQNPIIENEIPRVATEMRAHGETLPPDTEDYSVRLRIWDVYSSRLFGGDEKTSFLAALPPEDHLATFRWLFPEGTFGPGGTLGEDKQWVYAFVLAQLLENKGDRAGALETYRTLLGRLSSKGMKDGRIVDETRQSIERLQRR